MSKDRIMREDLDAKEEAEIDRKEELADNRAAEWASYWENFRSSPPQLAEDAEAKIPPSAIEAMVPILRRISPVGPYAGNPDQVHRQNAARLLLAAFPEGAVTMNDKDIRILAERAYPGLRPSGFCSRHRSSNAIVKCQACFPDLNLLIAEHNRLKQRAWKALQDVQDERTNGATANSEFIEKRIREGLSTE